MLLVDGRIQRRGFNNRFEDNVATATDSLLEAITNKITTLSTDNNFVPYCDALPRRFKVYCVNVVTLLIRAVTALSHYSECLLLIQGWFSNRAPDKFPIFILIKIFLIIPSTNATNHGNTSRFFGR